MLYRTALGERYPFEYAAKLSLEKFDLSKENIAICLQKQQDIPEIQEIVIQTEEKVPDKKKKIKSEKKPQTNTSKKFKEVLFQILPCLNPALTDHLLKLNNINPNTKCSLNDLDQLKKVKYS